MLAASTGRSCSMCGVWSNPYVVSGAVTFSYLAFYTAYDKTEQRIIPSLFVDLMLIRKGWDWTLKELNKAISLSGMTLMLMSFLPEMKSSQKDLLWISMNMLWGHSVYSFYKFYQFDPRKVMSDKWIKTLSVWLGSAGQLALAAGYWGQISPSALVASATTLSIAHFWTMEVDYKYKLQVRPYAYLPFPLAAWALYKYFIPGK